MARMDPAFLDKILKEMKPGDAPATKSALSSHEPYNAEKVALLANDLNNVIQEISGYVELINKQSDTSERVKAFALAAASAASRAAKISNKLTGGFIQKLKTHTGGPTIAAGQAPPIQLPGAQEPIAEKEHKLFEERKILNPDGPKPLIMVVDDEEENCNLLSLVLVEAGYKVITAYNGFEAYSLLRQHGRKIKLVLMDYVMPLMNGTDAFKALKLLNPDIKAFILSGYQEAQENAGLLAEGLAGFLAKPYRVQELLTYVEEVLGREG